MAKQAFVILKLKDQFSKPLKIAEKGTKAFDSQVNKASQLTKHYAGALNNKLCSAAKAGAKAIGALGVAAAGVGLNEAVNMEGYKAQLETATKSTQKASKIMKYSIDLANKTPFEGGEMVEASAKFEAMGMSAKKWLTITGDMAGATNKSMDQATEAIIDAQTGELERMKEFGVTKTMIADKANKMFHNQQVVNNKGQIVDQEKFNQAMMALMKDKFAGGMQKQANTLKGAWSTVTGVTKSALANVLGMTSDGTIRAGSAFDVFKQKIQGVSEKLTQWQQDGTLDALAQKVGGYLSTAVNTAAKAIGFLKNNMFWIMPVMKVLVTGFLAFNVVNKVIGIFRSMRMVLNICKIAFQGLNLKALKWIAIGALIVGAIILLKNIFGPMIAKIREAISAIAGAITKSQIFKTVVNGLKTVIGFLRDKLTALYNKFQVVRNVVDAVKGAFTAFKDAVSGVIGKVKEFLGMDTNKTVTLNTVETHSGGKKGGHKALGTPYYAGGFTYMNEGGRGEGVVLPSGSQVIPADKTELLLKGGQGKNVTVNVTIQGNMIGNKKYMEETGEYIAGRILTAMNSV